VQSTVLNNHRIPRLAVVIISYNTCSLLRLCISSVLASAETSRDQLHVHLIVVDNASADGSAAMVQAEFPQVQLLALDENLGFSAGNNLALDALGVLDQGAAHLGVVPDYVLLLNPDAQVVGDALVQMVACLEADPTLAVCGAHLRYGDGRFQHGAFQFPMLTQIALDLFPVYYVPGAHRLYDSKFNGRYGQENWQGATPFPVDFVLGAALMARSAAIRAVGPLDDDYFMYCEEMDWCLRMKQAGWGVAASPTAYVIHHEGQSSKQARWTSLVRLWRSRFRFYQKYRYLNPPGYLFAVRILVRIAMRWRRREVQRQYRYGALTGVETLDALDAISTVSRM
jgi:hypothetical protein